MREGWPRALTISPRWLSAGKPLNAWVVADLPADVPVGFRTQPWVVPIPSDLVRILTEHLNTFGTADDGRLFATSPGGVVASSASIPDSRSRRPYDLRLARGGIWLPQPAGTCPGVDPQGQEERRRPRTRQDHTRKAMPMSTTTTPSTAY